MDKETEATELKFFTTKVTQLTTVMLHLVLTPSTNVGNCIKIKFLPQGPCTCCSFCLELSARKIPAELPPSLHSVLSSNVTSSKSPVLPFILLYFAS